MDFFFLNDAQDQFLALPKHIQEFIRKKLEKIKAWEWGKYKPLINMLPATHRLRVDDWRLILKQCDDGFEVLKVGHRSTVYKYE